MKVPLGSFDINVKADDYSNYTLLARLAYDSVDYWVDDNAEMTRYLLHFGADPNIVDDSEYSAMANAADYQEDEQFIEMLEAFNAADNKSLHIPDEDNETPLNWRAYGWNENTVHDMLNFGADPDTLYDGDNVYVAAGNSDLEVLLDEMYTGM